jgi:integration host factor subunit alpha
MVPTNPRNQPGAIMTLTKENLIQTLYDQSGFSKHQSKALVETVFELVKKALEAGDDVLISGFGKFSAKKKAPRKGRNPATGEALPLDARTVVTFRCSGILRDKVNGSG